MDIGMLTTGYPHRGDPVAGVFVRAMARALTTRGHTVRVLCAWRPGDVPVTDPGITVTTVPYRPEGTFYGAGAPHALRTHPTAVIGGAVFTLSLVATARALRACDALVSHFILPCGLVGGLVRAGRPHVAVVHGTDGRLLARFPRGFQRTVLSGATTVQCTHAGLARALAGAGVPLTVHPMGYDPMPDALASQRPPTGMAGPCTVLAVGRLVRVKRLDRVLTAVAQARSQGADITLVVVGDGPERGALMAQARTQPWVQFTGALAPWARDGWLARSDVFVHGAGADEGAPVAVLEAMGAGLPVVAMDAPGVVDLVGDAGVIVPTVDAMARALTQLAGDTARRHALGQRARVRVAGLQWTVEAQRLEGLLRGMPPTGG